MRATQNGIRTSIVRLVFGDCALVRLIVCERHSKDFAENGCSEIIRLEKSIFEMMSWYIGVAIMILNVILLEQQGCCEGNRHISTWEGAWRIFPTSADAWSLETRVPMTTDYEADINNGEERGKFKVKKTFKRFMMPLLLAYKLKFFTLIPLLLGGLVLLTGATGFAGFFFALFAAVMGLRGGGH